MDEHSRSRRSKRKPAGKVVVKATTHTVQTVEAALKIETPRAVDYVKKMRKANPGMSRADLLQILESKFRLDAALSGREAGAAIFSGAASAAFARKETLEVAVFFVVAATEAYGIPLSALEYRKELVRAVLLVKKSDWAASLLATRTAPHWAGKIVARIPDSSTRRINAVMGEKFFTLEDADGGIVLAEAVERELASTFGSLANSAFAWNVMRVTRRTLESSELAFGIDGDVVDEDLSGQGPS